MTRNNWFHYLILFMGILCISWSAIFVKLADVSGLSSAFYRMFIGFLGVLPIWILRRKTATDKKSVRIAVLISVFTGSQLTGFSIHSWEALIGLGLISQLGGWLAINYAMAYMPSTIASVSLLSKSVFTALIAVPVLNEKLTEMELFGAVIVLCGIFLVNKKMFKRKVAVQQEYD